MENRHSIYETVLPAEWLEGCLESLGMRAHLRCLGLDYSGWIAWNGAELGTFGGSYVPHEVELTRRLQPGANVLRIVLDLPPRWLGQFGRTSMMREWKPRYSYSRD